jgi:ribonuclease-3
MRPNSSHTGKRRKNRARGAEAPPQLAAEQREACEVAIGHRFKNAALLDRAMTHRSATHGKAAEWSNERLEFLGDRVLGLVIADALYLRFPVAREGDLAPRLNALVSRETCAKVGAEIGLGEWLIVDKAERSTGGATKPSLLAAADVRPRDAKTALQEWAQGEGRKTPVYRLEGREGPDHAPVFTVIAIVDGAPEAAGTGASKQEAERAAAKALLTALEQGESHE